MRLVLELGRQRRGAWPLKRTQLWTIVIASWSVFRKNNPVLFRNVLLVVGYMRYFIRPKRWPVDNITHGSHVCT